MLLNNKGFAISTILYGILSLTIIILLLILALMKSNIDMNKDLVEVVESGLNKCINQEVDLEKCYFSMGTCDVSGYNNCVNTK